MPEQPATYYDAFFERQAAYHTGYRDSFYFPLWVQVEFILRPFKAYRILDVGCGPGQFARFLQDMGYEKYRGVDFSGTAVEMARANCDFEFRQGDALKADTYKPDFDVFVSLETLEHLNKDLDVLRNVPQGTFCVISVPNFDDPGHVRWFRSYYQVRRRYYRFIDIERMHFINNIYVMSGVRKDFRPNVLQRIFKTRDKISLGSIWARIWHRVLHGFKIKHE